MGLFQDQLKKQLNTRQATQQTQKRQAEDFVGFDDAGASDDGLGGGSDDFGGDAGGDDLSLSVDLPASDVDTLTTAIEDAVDDVFQEVQAQLEKAKASHRVTAATIVKLRNAGILVSNPYKLKESKIKLNAKEEHFVANVTKAAKEAVELILKGAAKKLQEGNYGKQTVAMAKALDKRLAKDGYLITRIANPGIRPEYQKKQAELEAKKQAASKAAAQKRVASTRDNGLNYKDVLGLN